MMKVHLKCKESGQADLVEVLQFVQQLPFLVLYRLRKYLIRPTILCLYKSQIRLQMVYCCHLSVGNVQSALREFKSIYATLSGEDLPILNSWNVTRLSLLPWQKHICIWRAAVLNSTSYDFHYKNPPCHVYWNESSPFLSNFFDKKGVPFEQLRPKNRNFVKASSVCMFCRSLQS